MSCKSIKDISVVSMQRELREYREKVLNQVEWLVKTYSANGSIIQQLYKNCFKHLLEQKVTSIIITESDEWIMEGSDVLYHSNRNTEGFVASREVKRVLYTQIAEHDPILSKYMKVVENTKERVEIHYVYSD